MSEFVTLIEELHDLRDQATRMELIQTSEHLRVAIIETAIELDCPTGLKVKDLVKGRAYSQPS